MAKQTLQNKLAEIKYRQKISAQHSGLKIYFENEPDNTAIRKLQAERLNEYRKTFSELKRKKVLKSPFLEIGAEYALASSYLKSKFALDGIACDISFYSLKYAKYFANLFKLKNVPTLVCTDTNNLPFKSNTFPFIFVYESLHHFPHPMPPLVEIHRILAPGGTLLIGSEPIKQDFQIKLWRRPTKLRIWEKLLKVTLVLPFISHIGKTEVDSGILEESFPLKTWLASLSIFDSFDAQIEPPYINLKKRITSDQKSAFPLSLLISLTGGGIKAICKKATNGPSAVVKHPVFICPNCQNEKEVELKNLSCPRCKNTYFEKGSIPILLTNQIAQHLVRGDK